MHAAVVLREDSSTYSISVGSSTKQLYHIKDNNGEDAGVRMVSSSRRVFIAPPELNRPRDMSTTESST